MGNLLLCRWQWEDRPFLGRQVLVEYHAHKVAVLKYSMWSLHTTATPPAQNCHLGGCLQMRCAPCVCSIVRRSGADKSSSLTIKKAKKIALQLSDDGWLVADCDALPAAAHHDRRE